ncbi:MAG: hypothetical protein LBL26_14515 [Peptococcaceae bacterium]|jgi:hypothetical protein|nr:hypothetical protein [Peptococcaceae bacterium]
MIYREIIELNDRDDDDDEKQNPRWIRLTPAELVMEGVSAIALIATFILMMYYWGKVDDEIPVYFIYGVAMAWLSKAYLLIIPFIALILGAVMSLYAYMAQKSVAAKLKAQKFARMQYLVDRFYLSLIKMEVMIILFIMERRTILLALGQRLGSFEMIVFAVALVVTLVKYISRRAKIT